MPKRMHVRLTLVEEALGTSAGDRKLHDEYVTAKLLEAVKKGQRQAVIGGQVVKITEEQAKALMEGELGALDADGADSKGQTVFPRMTVGDDADVPFVYDYQLKGFFKDAAKMLRKMPGSECSGVKAYKQAIDGLVFIDQRQVPWLQEDGMPAHVSGTCERPLRAATPQGERVALASSEVVPAGSVLDFRIIILDDSLLAMVKECLAYGQLRGLCQWRNSGKGKFHCDVLKVDSFRFGA